MRCNTILTFPYLRYGKVSHLAPVNLGFNCRVVSPRVRQLFSITWKSARGFIPVFFWSKIWLHQKAQNDLGLPQPDEGEACSPPLVHVMFLETCFRSGRFIPFSGTTVCRRLSETTPVYRHLTQPRFLRVRHLPPSVLLTGPIPRIFTRNALSSRCNVDPSGKASISSA
jgi:hypothetical protein